MEMCLFFFINMGLLLLTKAIHKQCATYSISYITAADSLLVWNYGSKMKEKKLRNKRKMIQSVRLY